MSDNGRCHFKGTTETQKRTAEKLSLKTTAVNSVETVQTWRDVTW